MKTDKGARLESAALVVLAAVVAGTYLLFPHLPFQDLPGHTGLLAVRERLDGSLFLRRYFAGGSLLGPYGLYLGLGHLLAGVVGPELALRVLGASAHAALAGAALLARRWLFAEAWTGAGFLALALSLGFTAALGFTSFLLGQAVLVLALARFVRWVSRPPGAGPREEVMVAGLAAAAALTHGFAFVLLGLGALIAAGSAERPRLALGRLRVLAPGALVLLAVALRDRGLYPAQAAGLFSYAGFSDKLELPFLVTLLSRYGVDVGVAVAAWALLGAAVGSTLARGGRVVVAGAGPPAPAAGRERLALARIALVLAALAFVAPTQLRWFGSIDLRLVSTALLVATLGTSPGAHGPRLARVLRVAPPWLATGMVGTLVVAVGAFQAEARPAAAVLRHVPAHARLLHLPLEPRSRVWAARPFLHVDKLVLLDRDVLVSDTWLHNGTALRPVSAAALPQPVPDSDRGDIAWGRYDLEAWDFVLVRTGSADAPPVVPPALAPVAAGGGSFLYRRGP